MNTQKRLIPKGKGGWLARIIGGVVRNNADNVARRSRNLLPNLLDAGEDIIDIPAMEREIITQGRQLNAMSEAAENLFRENQALRRQAAERAAQAASTSADDIAQRVVTRNADDAVAAADDVVSSATTPSPTRKPRKPRKPKETPAQPQNTSNTPAWLWRTAENSPTWNKWGRYAWNTGVWLSAADAGINGIKAVRAGIDEDTEYTPAYFGPISWGVGLIDAATTPTKPQEKPEKASSRMWIPK